MEIKFGRYERRGMPELSNPHPEKLSDAILCPCIEIVELVKPIRHILRRNMCKNQESCHSKQCYRKPLLAKFRDDPPVQPFLLSYYNSFDICPVPWPICERFEDCQIFSRTRQQ